jgi:hypothetical protein
VKGGLVQAAFVAYWSSVFYVAALLGAAALAWRTRGGAVAWRLTGLAPAVAVAVLAAALAHALFYLALPNYADYGEPVIPLLAANLLNGAPVYADWTTGRELVGSNYGPLVFVAQALALSISASVAASKLVGIVFAAAGLAALHLASARRLGSARQSLELTAFAIVLMAFNLHYWFWSRPDSMLIALVAFAALGLERLRPAFALVLIGLLAGLSMNLKLFGAAYLTPLAFACLIRLGWREAALAIAAGGILFLAALGLPFALPSFDASAYLANVLLMTKQGVIVPAIFASLAYGLVILAPAALAQSRVTAPPPGERATLGVLALVVVGTAVLSGKPGGGPPYMMPFVPLSLYLTARALRAAAPERRVPLAGQVRALFLAALVAAAPLWAYSVFQMGKQLSPAESAKSQELRALFRRYPDAQMGVAQGGEPSRDEFLRVQKALLGQTTRFDYVNYADQRLAGVPVSVVYPFVEGCRVPAWVFPRSAPRFTGRGYGEPLFDDTVRALFLRNYRSAERGTYYEVWRCVGPSRAP